VKFARRRSPEPADAPAPAAPPPPRPPRGAPVCTYADLLDGHTLWLAIETRPGALALRDTETGEVVPLVSELVDDPTEHRSVRTDLAALTAPSYDVVLVPGGGGAPLPVWTAPLPAAGRTRVPQAADGQRSLHRTGDGMLQVRLSEGEPGVLLGRLELLDDAIVLHVPGADGELVLRAELDDAPVLRVPLIDGRAVLPGTGLPESGDVMTRVVVERAGTTLPVLRRANDLANPGHATLLPALVTPDDGRPLLRLRWKPSGALMARLHPEGAA
jgi:hypothetical protein